jgi:hypothetical protein
MSGTVELLQELIELGGGQFGDLDVADQWHRDVTRKVDMMVAGKIRHLEDIDA